MRTAGIVLCGGSSKRMKRSKAWLPFGNQFLLNRVVERISQSVSLVVVVAAAGQELPVLPVATQVICDEAPNCGPLGGLAAGLAAIDGAYDAAYVSSCDTPFVAPMLIRKLFDLLGKDVICIPLVGDRLHPLSAVYRTEVLTKVRSQLTLSRLRLLDLVEELPTRVVSEAELSSVDPKLRSFVNVNTPTDYELALREAGYA
jgi:molybdenum cofactor guanylyltransferase